VEVTDRADPPRREREREVLRINDDVHVPEAV
jgi:hypothetical protein